MTDSPPAAVGIFTKHLNAEISRFWGFFWHLAEAVLSKYSSGIIKDRLKKRAC